MKYVRAKMHLASHQDPLKGQNYFEPCNNNHDFTYSDSWQYMAIDGDT